MRPIDSLDDPRIGAYRDIANPAAIERAGLFVAEGRFVVQRLFALDRFRTRSVLASPAAHAALSRTTKLPAATYVVEQRLMDAIVGFNLHRGCIALADRPQPVALDALPLTSLARVLVLEGVNNPDNVGGLFRSAAAFGVDAIVLGPKCGDPLYRKAIRTSMAATLQLPFVTAAEWPTALTALRASGMRVLALTTSPEAASLDTMPRDAGRVALVVGNEGEGLTGGAVAAADRCVRVGMTGVVDSLNVTVAASITMHHFFRIAPLTTER